MRVQLLSPDAAHLVGFAKKKLRQLRELREKTGQAIWSKNLTVGDFQIYLETANWGDKIRLSGGEVFDIILTNGEISAVYGWKKDNLQKTSGLNRPLSQAFSNTADGGEFRYTINKSKVVAGNRNNFTDSVMIYDYDAAGLRDGSLFRVESKNHQSSLATLEGVFAPYKLSSHGFYIGALTLDNSAWNKQDTLELSLINVVNPAGSEPNHWRWTPRIWCPELGNLSFLEQGIYYGSVNSFWGPYGVVEAEFGCILDNRGGSKKHGYCEVFTFADQRMNEEESPPAGRHLKAFFFFSLWSAPKNYFTHLNINKQLTISHNYWSSSPAPSFSIYYDDLLPDASIDIQWWSAVDLPPDENSLLQAPINVCGVLAVGPSKGFVLHRVATTVTTAGEGSAVSLSHKGTNYHSHSVSSDGVIVAIFAGGDIIEDVFVYDLAENKTIRATSRVIGNTFMEGEIIPKNIPSFSPKELPPVGTVIPLSRPVDTASALSPSFLSITHPWPVSAGYAAGGWMVDVKENKKGRGYMWNDECWESTYARTEMPVDAVDMSDIENLIGYNFDPAASGMSFFAQAAKTGAGDSNKITAVGAGSVVGRVSPSFAVNVMGCLVPTPSAKEPITWTNAVYDEALNCYKADSEVCAASIDVTMTDACGFTYTQSYELPEPDEITLEGPAGLYVGAQYVASGGTPGYTYTISGANTISPDGLITEVCTSPATITVTDFCGETVSLTVATVITSEPLWLAALASQSGAPGWAAKGDHVGTSPGNWSSTTYCYVSNFPTPQIICVSPTERVAYVYLQQFKYSEPEDCL